MEFELKEICTQIMINITSSQRNVTEGLLVENSNKVQDAQSNVNYLFAKFCISSCVFIS